VWAETRDHLHASGRQALAAKAESNPKQKMALVFRWYFGYSTAAAFAGRREDRVDYQVQTGPALGAFNQWVKGTPLEPWRARHADEIGVKLMAETARHLGERFGALLSAGAPGNNNT
jgi:trans-AT polyketide synthase/acyltransferase/oxidoreductase domain-containing protein